jgi:hypothetical protein
MSEKVLRFLLSELETVRLICRNCKIVIEMPTSKLADTDSGISCPTCRAFFPKGQNKEEDHLGDLARAIWGLKNLGQEIEFVIPAGDDAPRA